MSIFSVRGDCDEIHQAAVDGDVAAVKRLLQRDPNLVRDKYGANFGDTPLHNAADCGRAEVAKLLVAFKADVNARGYNNDTPLIHAAKSGSQQVARVLLASGASVDLREDRSEWSALHYAAYYGNPAVVELLLDYGADVNAIDDSGTTALTIAENAGHNDVVKALLKRGGSHRGSSKKPAAQPVSIRGANQRFESPYGFSFEPPAGWNIAAEEAVQEFAKSSEAILSGTDQPNLLREAIVMSSGESTPGAKLAVVAVPGQGTTDKVAISEAINRSTEQNNRLGQVGVRFGPASVTKRVFGSHQTILVDVPFKVSDTSHRLWEVLVPANGCTIMFLCTAPAASFDSYSAVCSQAIGSLYYAKPHGKGRLPIWLLLTLLVLLLVGARTILSVGRPTAMKPQNHEVSIPPGSKDLVFPQYCPCCGAQAEETCWVWTATLPGVLAQLLRAQEPRTESDLKDSYAVPFCRACTTHSLRASRLGMVLGLPTFFLVALAALVVLQAALNIAIGIDPLRGDTFSGLKMYAFGQGLGSLSGQAGAAIIAPICMSVSLAAVAVSGTNRRFIRRQFRGSGCCTSEPISFRHNTVVVATESYAMALRAANEPSASEDEPGPDVESPRTSGEVDPLTLGMQLAASGDAHDSTEVREDDRGNPTVPPYSIQLDDGRVQCGTCSTINSARRKRCWNCGTSISQRG